MRAKTFDCVEVKHRGAEKVREQTKVMTPEQELAGTAEQPDRPPPFPARRIFRSHALERQRRGIVLGIHTWIRLRPVKQGLTLRSMVRRRSHPNPDRCPKSARRGRAGEVSAAWPRRYQASLKR